MSSMTASAAMPRRRRIGQASRLMQTLRWATRRILLRLAPMAGVAGVESRRCDIARVRSLAAQVRRSQPGYADDLEAAASALEAQQPA